MTHGFIRAGWVFLLCLFCPAFLWAEAPIRFNIVMSASGPTGASASGDGIARNFRSELKQLRASRPLDDADINVVVVRDEVVVQGEVTTNEQFAELLKIARRTPGVGKMRSESFAEDRTLPIVKPSAQPFLERVDEPILKPSSETRSVLRDVRTNEAGVSTAPLRSASRGDSGLADMDREIGREVATRLQEVRHEQGWENYGVRIDVHEGAVSLSGTVATMKQKLETLDIVIKIPGVAEVIHDLRIGSAAPLSSEQVAQSIRNQLNADAQLYDSNISNIDVQVNDGVAWLRGAVASAEDKERALRITSYSAGVERVADGITLNGPAPIFAAREVASDRRVIVGEDNLFSDDTYGLPLYDVPFQDGFNWSCGDGCCGAWYGSQRLWVRGEYLMWWAKGNQLPPLVTTSSAGTPRPRVGVLGDPNTSILLGDERVDGGTRNGGRMTGVWWLEDSQLRGVEATWFSLDGDEGDDTRFTGVGTGGSPILARPFFNVGTGAQDSQLVSFPNVVDGVVSVTTSTEAHSAGIVSRRHWRCGPRGRVDWLIGYRYMRFTDELLIRENLASTDPGGLIAVGTTFDVFDSFEADNHFHGIDLGLATQLCSGRATLETKAKLAVGADFRQLNIGGGTTVTVPGVPSASSVGGLLALSSNIGDHSSTKFAVLPELDINLLYQVTPRLQCTLGYSLIGLTGVLRSGDQIDLQVDSTGLPTAGVAPGAAVAGSPAVLSNDSSVWLQGLSLGLELRR